MRRVSLTIGSLVLLLLAGCRDDDPPRHAASTGPLCREVRDDPALAPLPDAISDLAAPETRAQAIKIINAAADRIEVLARERSDDLTALLTEAAAELRRMPDGRRSTTDKSPMAESLQSLGSKLEEACR